MTWISTWTYSNLRLSVSDASKDLFQFAFGLKEVVLDSATEQTEFTQRFKMVSPWMSCLALFIACISLTQAGEQDRDHLSVGIMIKPDNCPRESKDGDVLVVRYNNTLIDQTPVLPVR